MPSTQCTMLYLDQGVVEHDRCDLTETHDAYHLLQPELICLFSGYDGHRNDCGRRITEWTEQDFERMTCLVLDRAALARCPVLSVHGGGYQLPVTIASATHHITVLATYWPGAS